MLEIRKSLLLVITTGFFGVLKGNFTAVVRWWSKSEYEKYRN